MKRDISYLLDILEAMELIDTYTQGIDYETFSQRQMLIDAVIRNLEIIGEAAKYAPDEIRVKYAEIPWRKMIGLRNILIHNYSRVDEFIVWNVVKLRLPEIKPYILKVIQEEQDRTEV
jgi:uncharacterized protein with HEPN domain